MSLKLHLHARQKHKQYGISSHRARTSPPFDEIFICNKIKAKVSICQKIFFFQILCESEFHGTLNILRFSGRHDAVSSIIENNREFSRKKILLTWWACQQFSNRFLISTSTRTNFRDSRHMHRRSLFIAHPVVLCHAPQIPPQHLPLPPTLLLLMTANNDSSLKWHHVPSIFPIFLVVSVLFFNTFFLSQWLPSTNDEKCLDWDFLFSTASGSSGALGVVVNIFHSGIHR